jgi:hypothetical protein
MTPGSKKDFFNFFYDIRLSTSFFFDALQQTYEKKFLNLDHAWKFCISGTLQNKFVSAQLTHKMKKNFQPFFYWFLFDIFRKVDFSTYFRSFQKYNITLTLFADLDKMRATKVIKLLFI